jgi:hypothetical protein
MNPLRISPSKFLAFCLVVFAVASIASAQSTCGIYQSNSRYTVPANSGNITGITTAGGSQYLYVMTQFGFARSSLALPGNPSSWALGQIGLKFQNGGRVPMVCDCWQGGTTMDVAEAPDGSSRMMSDWYASRQGGGLPGQVARATGGGAPDFARRPKRTRCACRITHTLGFETLMRIFLRRIGTAG